MITTPGPNPISVPRAVRTIRLWAIFDRPSRITRCTSRPELRPIFSSVRSNVVGGFIDSRGRTVYSSSVYWSESMRNEYSATSRTYITAARARARRTIVIFSGGVPESDYAPRPYTTRLSILFVKVELRRI